MKRSQMGKQIQHFLENYNKDAGLFGRKNEQAFELLDLIESLGMIPNCKCDQDSATVHYHPEECVYEWEKE